MVWSMILKVVKTRRRLEIEDAIADEHALD